MDPGTSHPVRNLALESQQAAQQGVVVSEQDEATRDLGEELEKKRGNVKEVSPLQREGLTLAKMLLWAIFVFIVLIGLGWMFGGPDPPTVQGNVDQGKAAADNYKALRETYLENGPKELFDVVVTSGLIPIPTLILGYIFGSQEAAK